MSDTKAPQSPSIDPMDDLFADLERSLSLAVFESENKKNKASFTQQVKAARVRISQPSCQGDERQELLAMIDRWEQANIWVTSGIAAMIKRTSCSCCGELSVSPIGYYKHQTGRQDPSLQRWVKFNDYNPAAAEFSSVPKEVIFSDETSEFCLKCLDITKFDPAKGMVKCLTPALVEKLHEVS